MILLSGSLLCSAAFTNDSLVFKKIEVFLEAPDVLVDVAYGVEDRNEKKKVKFK